MVSLCVDVGRSWQFPVRIHQGDFIMSDAQAAGFGDFGKWVPGFDFLQSLTQPAPTAASPMGHWVAPTLNVEELDKRIQELKAVLFWLEQNGTALKATIQALEVQKMTLSALKGMNVSMQDMAQAFSAKPSSPAQAPAATAAAEPAAKKPEPAAPAAKARAKSGKAAARAGAAAGADAAMVDPMQWWGALTQQFQQIASTAMADAQSAQARAAGAAAAGNPAPKKAATKKPAKRAPAPSRKSPASR
jgi:hypothetical protein